MTVSKYDPIRRGNPIKNEIVEPVKKPADRQRLKNYWLHGHNQTGRRNWMIFRLGMVTGLRASDLVRLRWQQVYDDDNQPRPRIYNEKDQKTGKINHLLDIRPVHDDLVVYKDFVTSHVINNPTVMFPQLRNPRKSIQSHTLYKIMRKAGDDLGLNHLGSHSIRKTFGYIAYSQTHNLGYVMKKLNQSNPSVTLRYIGIERASINKITDSINWN